MAGRFYVFKVIVYGTNPERGRTELKDKLFQGSSRDEALQKAEDWAEKQEFLNDNRETEILEPTN